MEHKEITRCRICGNTRLIKIVDLGTQALSGRFPLINEPDPLKAPLQLVKCDDHDSTDACGLVQLRQSVPLSNMYGEGYGYRSGINQTMSRHLAEIALSLQKLAHVKSGDILLDIGSNDGTLLNAYTVKGIHRLGMDPSAGPFKQYYQPGVLLVEDFFSKKSFRSVFKEGKAKIITSIAMFYDLESPLSFMQEVADLLDPEGIWALEQSYMPTMLEMNAFDTICHEHLEYYALKQIQWMGQQCGLRIIDVSLNDINGGSFLLKLCHKDASYTSDEKAIKQFIQREQKLRLDTKAPYEAFNHRISALKEVLLHFLNEEKQRGKSIYLYGASTKGNVLLQYFGINGSVISGAAERNPWKFGRWTPATHIPIVSEEQVRKEAPDYFLVLPWHFREEFVARERAYLENGGHFIFPLPQVVIVGSDDVRIL